MKKFKFSMQNILNVRHTVKDVCRMELAKARAKLEDEKKKLADIKKQIRDALLAGVPEGESSGYFFLQREKYIRSLKQNRKKQEYKVQEAAAEVDSCLQRYKEADVEVKKMEKVLEKEFKNWNYEFLRDEQKINDEIGSSRFAFKEAART